MRRPRRGARELAAGAATLLMALMTGCATGVPELWPPAPGQATRTVLISLDTWHAMIAFPDEPRGFEEWGYAEQAWYLEGRQGASGAVRALLWPTAGVVEVTRADRIWAERTPQPPADVFAFSLTEAGYDKLRAHLQATLGGSEPVAVVGASRFYRAKGTYHLFHQCHQYAARALREAGLPVSRLWAFGRSSFAAQLRHAEAVAAHGPR